MSKKVFNPFVSSDPVRALTWMNQREVVEIGGEEFVQFNCSNPTFCRRDEHHHDSESDAIRDLISQLQEEQSKAIEAYNQEITRWQEKLSAIETEVAA